MTVKTFKLLMSARDPGAAHSLAPVAELALQHDAVKLTLVASPPAIRIFQDYSLPVIAIPQQESRMLAIASQLIEQHAPDAILCGLSGPGRGIDEALLAASGDIPTAVIQDFWGDMNPGFGSYADTYFVRDHFAAGLTRQRASVKTLITGTPRAGRIPSAWRQQQLARSLHKRYRIPLQTPIIVLATQPLWDHPGYRDTLRETLIRLPQGHLLIRMHPKDGVDEKHHMHKLVRNHCRIPWRFCDDQFDASLASANLVLSAFSNAGLDKTYFNRPLAHPQGIPVFLLHNARLRTLFQLWTGLDDHPLSKLGISHSSTRLSRLGPDLKRVLSQPARHQCGQAIRHLPSIPNSARRILEHLFSSGQGTELS